MHIDLQLILFYTKLLALSAREFTLLNLRSTTQGYKDMKIINLEGEDCFPPPLIALLMQCFPMYRNQLNIE